MPDNELLSVAYRKTLKLALAVSIIRCKPSNLSSREYAEHIAQQIKRSEASWKSKYEQVSAELLEAKQQVLLLQSKNEAGDQPRTCIEVSDEIGHPESHSVTSEDKRPVPHNFLSSIASLKQWNEMVQTNQRSMDTIKGSICASLQQFTSCLDEIPLNHHNFILISENLRAMSELAGKMVTTDNDLFFYCTNIVEKLIRIIVSGDAELMICEKLSGLLLILGETGAPLRDVILEKLVDTTCRYSKFLEDTDSFSELDPGTYERMFFICDAITQLFTCTSERWPLVKHDLLAKQLEEGILPISGRYPMYAYEVWIISSLLVENLSGEEEDSLFSQKDSL